MNISPIEKTILNIINKLRNEKHKRPSAKQILETINRDIADKHCVDLSVFKEAMLNLSNLNIIYDGGQNGSDSYFINADILGQYNMNDEENPIDVLQTYIDDKFYEVLINRIKLEVKNELTIF